MDSLEKFYEKNYAIKDSQDLLAMCLIELAAKLESLNNSADKDNKDVELTLANIESDLSKVI